MQVLNRLSVNIDDKQRANRNAWKEMRGACVIVSSVVVSLCVEIPLIMCECEAI